MVPVVTKNTSVVLGAPKDWDEEKNGPCGGLPVVKLDGVYFSYWQPNTLELEALQKGGLVQLCVAGTGHPPVSIEVSSYARD